MPKYNYLQNLKAQAVPRQDFGVSLVQEEGERDTKIPSGPNIPLGPKESKNLEYIPNNPIEPPQSTFKKNKDEIAYHIINSILAGFLACFGAVSNGGLTLNAVLSGIMAGSIVALIKFKDYWEGEKKEYENTYFTFF